MTSTDHPEPRPPAAGRPRRVTPLEGAVLAGALLLALGLRLWGAGFGLPQVVLPGEASEVHRAVRLATGDFALDHGAAGGHVFLLSAEYLVYGLTRSASADNVDLLGRLAIDPVPFWRIGRTTAAVLGTVTVFLVWFQGRRMRGARVGALAALFLAVSGAHVFGSHVISEDVPRAMWIFLAVMLAGEAAAGRALFRLALLVPVAALAGFLILGTDPVRSIHGAAHGSTQEWLRDAAVIWRGAGAALIRSQGPALAALSALGMGLGVAQRGRASVVHGSFVLAFLALLPLLAGGGAAVGQQVVPVTPALCLFAGLALDEFVRRLQGALVPAPVLIVATAALVAFEPAAAAVRSDQRLAREDTRAQAARWLDANLPHRARVLLEGRAEEAASLSVPVRNRRKNVKEMIDRLEETDPARARYWTWRLEAQPKPMFDLVTVPGRDPWKPLGDYLAQGVQYVIVRREFFLPGTPAAAIHPAPRAASRFSFYEELLTFPRAELLASFEATPDGDPGYDIEIWRLHPPGMSVAAETE